MTSGSESWPLVVRQLLDLVEAEGFAVIPPCDDWPPPKGVRVGDFGRAVSVDGVVFSVELLRHIVKVAREGWAQTIQVLPLEEGSTVLKLSMVAKWRREVLQHVTGAEEVAGDGQVKP